jgi:hypothetical protein
MLTFTNAKLLNAVLGGLGATLLSLTCLTAAAGPVEAHTTAPAENVQNIRPVIPQSL